MKTGRLVGEDADLESTGGVFRQVQQAGESIRFCGLEVVGGEQPDSNAALECLLQVVADESESGPHHETHDQVRSVETVVSQAIAQGIEDAALLVVQQARIRLGQVVASPGQGVPNAAPRVECVSGVSRDDVDVQVVNRLACGGARVEANVVTVRVVFPIEDLLHRVDEFEKTEPLLRGGVPPRGDETTRYDERVTGAHRKLVGYREGDSVA